MTVDPTAYVKSNMRVCGRWPVVPKKCQPPIAYDFEFRSNEVVDAVDTQTLSLEPPIAYDFEFRSNEVVDAVDTQTLSLEEWEMPPSPHVIYDTASTVDMELPAAALGNTLLYKLQDGLTYSFSGGETWDITVSGIGGLDTGTEQSDAFYYLYLVPDGGVLKTIGSLTDPDSGGPLGYSNYLPVVAVLNRGGNIRPFYVLGRDVHIIDPLSPASCIGTTYVDPPVEKDVTDMIPESAESALLSLHVQRDGSAWGSVGGFGGNVILDVFIQGHLEVISMPNYSTDNYNGVISGVQEYDYGTVEIVMPMPAANKKVGVRVFTDDSSVGYDHLDNWNIVVQGWREKYRVD